MLDKKINDYEQQYRDFSNLKDKIDFHNEQSKYSFYNKLFNQRKFSNLIKLTSIEKKNNIESEEIIARKKNEIENERYI